MNEVKILIIIPCYNEEENLERVVARLKKEAPQVDFLIVNDCSTDSSAAICKANGWRFLDLPTNLGIGGGVQSGYQYAAANDYDITVQMDGDGQHDPAYLEAVLAPVIAGELDMAVGSRFITKEGFQTSFMRRLGIRIISATIRLLCGARVLDVTSGFRACNKALTAFYARQYAQDYPEPEAIVSAVLNGYRVGEVPVVMQERMGGVSSINLLRSAYYMIKVPLALLVYRLSIRRKKTK